MTYQPQSLILTKGRRERITGGLTLVALGNTALMGTAIWQLAIGQLWLGIWLSVLFLALLGGSAMSRSGLA